MGRHPIDVECDWGLNGLRAVAHGRAVVIVDVLSFSTAVTVAVGRDAIVFPCEWNDARAEKMGRDEHAIVASKRGEGRFSLAPASLQDIEAGTRLVLPSPNGSTLAYAARHLGAAAIIVGCLRNAAAVAQWIRWNETRVALIAAGERWPDGTIRLAIEDWLGAGAIIAAIDGSNSWLATAAVQTFEAFCTRIGEVLEESPSGRELIENGYADDVVIASKLHADSAVPLLHENAFRLARS